MQIPFYSISPLNWSYGPYKFRPKFLQITQFLPTNLLSKIMDSSKFFLLLFFLTLAFLATILEAKKPKPPPVAVDNRTIDQIYEAALAEGGQLVVYANGNRAFQARTLSQTVPAFQRRFPGVNLTVVVDNTNTHASRANVQMALNSVVIDLIQLESVHDLYRWKEENDLHFYKPIVWDSIHPAFRDPDGAFTPISGTVFSMVVNTDLLPNETDWPKSFGDLVDDPKFYGKILAAYPVDVGSPDTTLFGYKQVIDKYGFDWMVKLMAQNVTIMRDSSLIPAALSSGQFSVGLFRPFPGNISNQRFILPENDKFVSYTVLTAIFNESPHKEAAKLYMNWQLEAGMQQTLPWTVREDVPPAAGFEHIWDYGAQSSYADFVDFYLDRAGAERTRNAIYLFVGEPKGPRPMDPNNQLGIRPH